MEPIEKAVAKALAAKQRAFSDKNADSTVDGHLADQQADRPLNADNVSNADYARKMPDESVAANLAPTMSACLLYTSPSPRDQRGSRMPSSA